MPESCSIPKCDRININFKRSLFKVPKDPELFEKWKAVVSVIPGIRKPIKNRSYICERHFLESDIIRKFVKFDNDGRLIAEVQFQRPRLRRGAIPSIFDPEQLLPDFKNNVIPNESSVKGSENIIVLSENDDNASKILPPASNTTLNYTSVQKSGNFSKNIPVNGHNEPKIPLCDITPGSSVLSKSNLNKDSSRTQNHSKLLEYLYSILKKDTPTINDTPVSNEHCYSYDFRKDVNIVTRNWILCNLLEQNKTITISHIRHFKNEQNIYHPIFDKYITIDENNKLSYFVFDRPLRNIEEVELQDSLSHISMLRDILSYFGSMRLCRGVGKMNTEYLKLSDVFRNNLKEWHSNKCLLVAQKIRCRECIKVTKVTLQREKRSIKRTDVLRVRKVSDLIDQKKFLATKEKLKHHKVLLKRITNEMASLRKLLNEKSNQLATLNEQTIDEKCAKLNISNTQKTVLREIISAASTSTVNRRRYSDEWIMLCLLLNMKSPTTYEFLRKNNVIPLPCARTIQRYFSLMNKKSGFDKNLFYNNVS